MKKTITLTVLLLVAFLGGASAQTSDFEVVTPSGHTLTFRISDTVAMVVGSPADIAGDLVIPDSVTSGGTAWPVASIGNQAFQNRSGLASVTLPSTLTSVGASAFRNCKSVYTLDVPSSVATIGNGAFYGLRHIAYTGPAAGAPWGAMNRNRYVADSAVYSSATLDTLLSVHSAVHSFAFPASTVFIGESAFYNCRNLTALSLPESIVGVVANPFEGCSGLTQPVHNSTLFVALHEQYQGSSYAVPEGITTIATSAFAFLQSTPDSLILPSSLQTLMTQAIPFLIGHLVLLCPEPPVIDNLYTYRTVDITVPCGSLAAYRAAGWGVLPTLHSDCMTAHLAVLTDGTSRNTLGSGDYEPGDTVFVEVVNQPLSAVFLGWSNGSSLNPTPYVVHEGYDTIYAFLISVADIAEDLLIGEDFDIAVNVFGRLGYGEGYSTHHIAPQDKGTIFSTALWLAADSQRVAAQTFGIDNTDFIPGPMRLDGIVDPDVAYCFNRVWHLTREQIDYHIAHCADAGYSPIDDIASWPGNGPDGCAAQMAPYFDADSNGIYQPLAGDYPIIRGDEALFSIFNDGAAHMTSGGTPLGVEVHCMTYAFHDTASNLALTIFSHYDIYNRSSNNYDNLTLGAFSDFDIGYSYDDYIGCDVGRSMYYGYNGFDEDVPSSMSFSGIPPAQSCTFLSAPMSGFQYYDNGLGIAGDPHSAADFYNYMHSRWLNGLHVKYGGNGLNGNTTVYDADYMYSGNTDPAFPDGDWTEASVGNPPNDRRGVGASRGHSLPAAGSIALDLAYTAAFGASSAWASVEALQAATDNIRRQYLRDTTDSGSPFVYMPYSAPHDVNGIDCASSSDLAIYPNPTTGIVHIDVPRDAVLQLFDMVGHCVLSTRVPQGTAALDLTSLPQGVYLVRMAGSVSRLVKR